MESKFSAKITVFVPNKLYIGHLLKKKKKCVQKHTIFKYVNLARKLIKNAKKKQLSHKFGTVFVGPSFR